MPPGENIVYDQSENKPVLPGNATAVHKGIAKGTIVAVNQADYAADVSLILSGKTFILQGCPILTPYAHGGTGVYFLPEIGDDVWVGFEDNQLHRGYVLGSVWQTSGPGVSNRTKQIQCKTSQIDIILKDTAAATEAELVFFMHTPDTGSQFLRLGHKGIDLYTEKKDINIKVTNFTINADNDVLAAGASEANVQATGSATIKCLTYGDKGLHESSISDWVKDVSSAAFIDGPQVFPEGAGMTMLKRAGSIATSAFFFALPFIRFAGMGATAAGIAAFHMKGQVTYNAPKVIFVGATHGVMGGLICLAAGVINLMGTKLIQMNTYDKISINLISGKLKSKNYSGKVEAFLTQKATKVKFEFEDCEIKSPQIKFLADKKLFIKATSKATFGAHDGKTMIQDAGKQSVIADAGMFDIESKKEVEVKGTAAKID